MDAGGTMTFESPPPVVCEEELDALPVKVEEYPEVRKSLEHSSSSSSSRSTSHSNDRGVSDDDDDDDRNHKHRKRDSSPQSFDYDNRGEILRRPISRPNRSDENGEFNTHRLLHTKGENDAAFDRNSRVKFEKHSSGLGSLSRASVDLGQRGRINQFRNNSGSHTDLAVPFSRPSGGRGRGRGMGNWNQHDSRFGSLGALEFPSHIAKGGPALPGLFVGANLPSTAGAQGASWGSFGFIPGIPNGCIDPLNPLSLPGALQSSIAPQLNLNMPRQRCRDFEEQGFCLRGDMCPMEHGVNRIVVDDVQSLSQFNLPVSLPSSQTGGLHAASRPLPSTSSSGLPRNKSIPSKASKSLAADEGLGLNRIFSSTGGDNDVYDPDKPLWNNDCLGMSPDLLRVSGSDGTETIRDAEPAHPHKFTLPYKSDRGFPSSSADDNSGSSHGRMRPNSGYKQKMSQMTKRADNITTETRSMENDTNGGEEVAADAHDILSKRAQGAAVEACQKTITTPGSMPYKGPRGNDARASQKALRTLFVSCIPMENNRRLPLISHFQKFGTIIDIHIPRNGDRAFVQFSKREEAEAALASPEAVMGNRFIKLFWANRDNIADDIEETEVGNQPSISVRATPSSLKPCIPGGIESLPLAPKTSVGIEPLTLAPKFNSSSTNDTALSPTIQPKVLIVNTPKVAPVVQKKRENLEILKEELRRKQELLDKKRNEFKNRLDKLEKQSLAAKKSGTVERPVKKQKVENENDVNKLSISKSIECSGSGVEQNALDINPQMDSFIPGNSRNDSPVGQDSSTNSVQTENFCASSLGRPFMDNRLFGFKIVPPLPADFASLAVIEDHFSGFQDLFSVHPEDPEAGSTCENLEPALNCSVLVLFSTRHSAERAFSDCSHWQGEGLKVAWLTDSSSNDQGTRAMPAEVDTYDNDEHMDADVANHSLDLIVEGQSSSAMQFSDK